MYIVIPIIGITGTRPMRVEVCNMHGMVALVLISCRDSQVLLLLISSRSQDKEQEYSSMITS